MTLQDIKETKRSGWKDGWTYGGTHGLLENSIHTTNKVLNVFWVMGLKNIGSVSPQFFLIIFFLEKIKFYAL